MGKQLRKVFKPKQGYIYVDADYSQIELRVLAHLSGDQVMQNAFLNHVDIHATTASEVFDVPIDQVTSLQRRNAKAVNFGIVYGISAFGLSEDLGISRKEAADYIEKYFATYKNIKSFLDRQVEEAKAKNWKVVDAAGNEYKGSGAIVSNLKVINVTADNAPYYDLQGRRIAKPTRSGLYIHNGKKIFIK